MLFLGNARLTATASDADTGGSVAKVEFFDGPTLIGTDTVTPYSYCHNQFMNSSSNRLIRGQAYFIVLFDDENLTVPLIQTLIYDQYAKSSDGTGCFLFKELHVGGEQSDFFVGETDLDHLLLDRAALLRKLKDSFDGKLLTAPSGNSGAR